MLRKLLAHFDDSPWLPLVGLAALALLLYFFFAMTNVIPSWAFSR